MLKQRLITASILIPIFILLVTTLSESSFYFLTALIVLCGAWEWSAFMEIKQFLHSLIFPLFSICILMVAYLFPIEPILYAAFAGWLVAIYLVVGYPKNTTWWSSGFIVRGFMGLIVLVP